MILSVFLFSTYTATLRPSLTILWRMGEFAYVKPHLSSKIQLKTWPLTSADYHFSSTDTADLLRHYEKVHYIHWHFKSDIYDTHLFWFYATFLSAANEWLKEKASQCERARGSKHKLWSLWSDRLGNNCCDCLTWQNLLIVSLADCFCGLNGSSDSFI